MAMRICNWCAKIGDDSLDTAEVWSRATLRVEGLDDGSISWLPERRLHFCSLPECTAQIERSTDFLLEMPLGASGILVRLSVFDTSDGVSFDETRRLDHPDAAEDVRALARFFNETSHPKLRAKLEAFRDAEEAAS